MFGLCILLAAVGVAAYVSGDDHFLNGANLGLSVVTLLLLPILQATQNRDGAALQAKLDELIKSNNDARDALIGLESKGEHEEAAFARRYGERSAVGAVLAFPGPVGERNTYELHPRGRILMRPVTRAGLFAQMAVILATGNSGTPEGMSLPDGLPPAVAAAFAAGDQPYAAALVEGGQERVLALLETVATFAGAIIPVHAADSMALLAYPLDLLLDEVSISVNTTAAGGNASLMMVT